MERRLHSPCMWMMLRLRKGLRSCLPTWWKLWSSCYQVLMLGSSMLSLQRACSRFLQC